MRKLQDTLWDLDNILVPEWIVTSFELKINNKVYESDLEDELIEMHVDLETKALFKSKCLNEYWSNINAATKYPMLTATEPFLLAFPNSYMVEVGLSNVNATLTKQRKRLTLQNHGDLRLKLIKFQPNINNLAAAHQAHPSH